MKNPLAPENSQPMGTPFEEGQADQIDPKTGRDISDITYGGAETMQVNIVDRNQHITHEGDMGRLGKSE
jgi:hypothetical protein